jgi:hypothetical protein
MRQSVGLVHEADPINEKGKRGDGTQLFRCHSHETLFPGVDVLPMDGKQKRHEALARRSA